MTKTSMKLDDPEPATAVVACVVCATEVPLDEMVVPEITDHLVYLCGLDCYARWRDSAGREFPSLATAARPRNPTITRA